MHSDPHASGRRDSSKAVSRNASKNCHDSGY
jgi:hypothetical protein